MFSTFSTEFSTIQALYPHEFQHYVESLSTHMWNEICDILMENTVKMTKLIVKNCIGHNIHTLCDEMLCMRLTSHIMQYVHSRI